MGIRSVTQSLTRVAGGAPGRGAARAHPHPPSPPVAHGRSLAGTVPFIRGRGRCAAAAAERKHARTHARTARSDRDGATLRGGARLAARREHAGPARPPAHARHRAPSPRLLREGRRRGSRETERGGAGSSAPAQFSPAAVGGRGAVSAGMAQTQSLSGAQSDLCACAERLEASGSAEGARARVLSAEPLGPGPGGPGDSAAGGTAGPGCAALAVRAQRVHV